MPQEKSLDWFKGIPNKLTLFRIGVIPVLLLLFPLDFESLNIFCAFLFAVAAMTDWLDGFIARQFKMESKLGTLIDPIADKLLTTAALVLLVANHMVWAWLAGLLLCRDVALSGVRLVAQEHGISIPVNWFGKFKTLFLDIAIFCLMVRKPLFDLPFREVGMVSLWVATFLSLFSAGIYIRNFVRKVEL